MNEKAVRAGELIAELVASGSAVAKLDGRKHELFPVAIDTDEGEALQRWVKKESPGSVIEIGLGYGFAALNCAKALFENRGEDFYIFTIDPNQEWRFSNLGLQFLEEIGAIDLVEHCDLHSEFILPQLQQKKSQYDFAIVDGNHRFEIVFLDLNYLSHLLKPGSVIFLDDYQLPAIRKAVAFFLSNLDWTLEEVSEESELHQWAVIRTRAVVPERDFKYFVDF